MKSIVNKTSKKKKLAQIGPIGSSAYRLITAVLLISAGLLYSCGDQQGVDAQAKIAVRWEAVTNFTDDPDRSEAQFVITNQGENLNANNWAIFFSKSPVLVEAPESGTLHIEHLNGDWYRISPREDFVLAPGDSLQLNYRAIGHYIKLSDAPMGMYVVFYDAKGNTTRIATVSQLEIAPFRRREQLLRGMNDGLEAFSSGNLYRQNEGLSLIPESELLPIIPSPYRAIRGQDEYAFARGLRVYHSEELSFEAGYLKTKMEELGNYSVVLSQSAAQPETAGLNPVVLGIDPKIMAGLPGAYTLDIENSGIRISGADAAGVFYGVQSLLALLYNQPDADKLSLPQLHVEDKPRFGFRSMHLDVSRNFQSKETVLKFLDILSHYKINNFLFYIAEDEAWRLEIPGLPELTELSSKRQHPDPWGTPAVHPAYGSGPFPESADNHGTGYFSVQDFVEILQYAHQRHINVVPAINFPGHSRASIMAMELRYQKYMSAGDPGKAEEYRLLDPEDTSVYLSAQHFKDNVINVSRESAYRFYEKVVDEMAGMYQQAGVPFRIIHTGGDEVASGAWSGSPEVQAWAARKNIPGTYSQIQAGFFHELMGRMEKRGLEVHGWEETSILHTPNSEYKPNPAFVGRQVVPYVWNNLFDYPDMSYQLANLGYEVILCNVSNLYFDLAYDNDPREPGLTWGGFINVRDAWGFAPYELYNTTFRNSMGMPMDLSVPEARFVRLRPEARKNIRGLQAQLWGETIKGPEMLEYYLLPKLIGFAETAWARERSWESIPDKQQRLQVMDQEWNVFANTIARREYSKLARWNGGYNFRVPTIGLFKDEQGLIHANNGLPGVEIRYTRDGSEPTTGSPLYEGPIAHQPGMKFRAFSNGREGFSESLDE